LGPLKELAAELRIAVIAVMHFNKKMDVINALLRICNSIAFAATSRHAYGVIEDPENDRTLMVRAKNNLAAKTGDKVVGVSYRGKTSRHRQAQRQTDPRAVHRFRGRLCGHHRKRSAASRRRA
jgi:hypothetical protein